MTMTMVLYGTSVQTAIGGMLLTSDHIKT